MRTSKRVGLLAPTALILALSTLAAEAQDKILRVAVFGPETVTASTKQIAEEISKGARVQISIIGQLSPKEILQSVRAGVVDGAVLPASVIGYPFNFVDVPAACSNSTGLAVALQKGLRPELEKQLAKAQPELRYLVMWPIDTWALVVRGTEPRTIADLRGLKLRPPLIPETQAVVAGLIESLGARPTTVAMSEVGSAITNGAIDGGYLPLSTVATSLKGPLYVSDAPGTGVIAAVMVINARSWNALADSTRNAVAMLVPELEQNLFKSEREKRAKVIYEVRNKGGAMLRTPPAGMKEHIAKAGLTDKSKTEYLVKNPTAERLVEIASSYMKVVGGTCQKCSRREECPCQNDLDKCSKECTDCCQ